MSGCGAVGPYGSSGLRTLDPAGGLRRGEQLATLLRHYHNWGRLDTRKEPIPQAFAENDQTAYAGLYVAQHFADTCRPTGGGGGAQGGDSGGRRRFKGDARRGVGGGGCFGFLHDGEQRCVVGGTPWCTAASLWRNHPLGSRMTLDYQLHLFENMYKAGAHKLEDGRLVHVTPQARPLVVHFNGPAKVSYEEEWQLRWDANAGLTPLRHLTNALGRTLGVAKRAAARDAFGYAATFLSPTLARLDMGPFNLTCDEFNV